MENERRMLRIRARSEPPVPSSTSGARGATTTHPPSAKLSAPALIGIVSVSLILIGLSILLWRWRVRVKHLARMSKQFPSSYVKYGAGQGIESTNSSTSSQKVGQYGSFFEAYDDEKPKKAILGFANFKRSSTANANLPAAVSNSPPSKQHRSWLPQMRKAAAAATAPYAYGGGGAASRSPHSSFSFNSPKKAEDKKSIKVQHVPTSIKAKGISAPLRVANGGPEPWSPPATDVANTGSSAARAEPVTPTPPPPRLPPPVAFSSKLKQPQPRSPPETAGTSQANEYTSPSSRQGRDSSLAVASSDGSLYSRNSFSSNHDEDDHHQPAAPPLSTGAVSERDGNLNNAPAPPQSLSLQPSSYNGYGYEGDPTVTRPGSASSQYNGNLPRLMTVISPFVPTMEDELPLRVGDTVRIIEKYKDGWCLVQQVGRMDSPRGVVPCVCLQERRRIVPVPVSVIGMPHKKSNASLSSSSGWR